MGLDNIPTRATGETILDEFFNVLKRVVGGDYVPRNVSGVATANAGHLGTETYPWKRAHVTTGYFICGMVIDFHDFDGELTPGQGWMKCNGDIVNETNYDAIHGAGSWDLYVGASPIEGKHLPSMNNKFRVGKTLTAQDGSVAITSEGNSNHQITAGNHTHSGAPHTHQWYNNSGNIGVADNTFDSNGNSLALSNGSVKSVAANIMQSIPGSGTAGGSLNDAHTSQPTAGSTGVGTAEVLDVKPESHAFQVWMRIV